MTTRGKAIPRWPARAGLLVFAEAAGEQLRDGVEAGVGVLALRRHGDGRALRGAEGQQAHDRAPADRLAAAGHGDVGMEALDGLDELRRGASVQALAVDDRQLAGKRSLRDGGRRAVLRLGPV